MTDKIDTFYLPYNEQVCVCGHLRTSHNTKPQSGVRMPCWCKFCDCKQFQIDEKASIKKHNAENL